MRDLGLALTLLLVARAADAQPAPPPAAPPGVPFPTTVRKGFGFTPPPKPDPLKPTPLDAVPEKPKKPDVDPSTGAPSFVAGKPIDHWVSELKSTDPTDREMAVKLLRGFGVEAVRKAGGIRVLLPLLEDPDPGVRVNAILTASYIGHEKPEEARQVADKLANSLARTVPGSVIRVHAANALAGVGEDAERAIPALIKASDDPAWETRRAIALALGRAGTVTFKDVAISPDGVISTTTQAVERPPSDQAMNALAFRLLRDPSAAVRAAAGQALTNMGPPRAAPEEYSRKAKPYIDAVLTRLKVEREPAAKVWLQLLVVMYDGSQLPAQLKAITAQVTAGDEATKAQSLLALAMLGSKARSSRLEINKALFDPDPGVAVSAITALLNLGDDAKLSVTELDRLAKVAKDKGVQKVAKDAAEQVRKLVPGAPVAPAPTPPAPMKK